MNQEKIDGLTFRNTEIINAVKKRIEQKCPGSIDLIGIGGSFCNGDFYEKSDLDLVLISKNNDAKVLDKCFILKDVGFDIYTHNFSSFEKMAEYENPYVTKLIDLKIIKTSEYGKKHYEELQGRLKQNMGDDDKIAQNIKKHYTEAINALAQLKITDNIGAAYRLFAEIIKRVEYIIYLSNRTYVKGSTGKIPSEIQNMKLLPEGFMEVYKDATSISGIEDVILKGTKLIEKIEKFLGYKLECVKNLEKDNVHKKKLEAGDLVGSYEEIYSNYKNKMLHAYETNDQYLSFITMANCQDFYNEFCDEFEIPKIDLIGKYDQNDLLKNVNNFDVAMNEWKKNYDKFGIKVCYYPDIDAFKMGYNSDLNC